MEDYADNLVRQTTENNIRALSKSLQRELAINDAQVKPKRKVHTSLLIVRDGDRFIALDGSAHRMGELFSELFERRPDLVGVVRDVLNKKFLFVDR